MCVKMQSMLTCYKYKCQVPVLLSTLTDLSSKKLPVFRLVSIFLSLKWQNLSALSTQQFCVRLRNKRTETTVRMVIVHFMIVLRENILHTAHYEQQATSTKTLYMQPKSHMTIVLQ